MANQLLPAIRPIGLHRMQEARTPRRGEIPVAAPVNSVSVLALFIKL